jgi:hypothetical protein
MISGPGADGELVLRQLAEWGGYGGKTNRERLVNTQVAIQAMAQLELNAASQIQGQGAVTDSERLLLRKVAAGNFKMTVPEMRALAEVVRRESRKRVVNYNNFAKRVAKLPGMENVAPLLEVDDFTPGAELPFDDQGRPVKSK